jgi:hypothetical protein
MKLTPGVKNQSGSNKNKSGYVLGGIFLIIALNFSNLFAGAANKTTYGKPSPGLNPGADTVTKSFSVSGKGACKSSIEGVLTGNSGVLSASWDSTAQVITVTFVKHLIKKTQLHRLLAQAGYDNANARAKDDAYNALPAACRYTRLAPSVTSTTN